LGAQAGIDVALPVLGVIALIVFAIATAKEEQ